MCNQLILQFSLLLKSGFRAIHSLVTSPARGHQLCLKLQTQFSFFFCSLFCSSCAYLIFNEATAPGYETISGTLPQCVVCCMNMHSFFPGLIRRMPPPTFSDTAVTDTLIPLFSNSEHTGCGYCGVLYLKKHMDMCCQWESNP